MLPKTHNYEFLEKRVMFRCSALRFHGYRSITIANFCNSQTAFARKLVDGSKESETQYIYLTYRETT